MYCSACGVAVAQGLSYCNYCGAKLNGKPDSASRPAEVRPELLVSAMAVVFVLGLGAITVLMGVMKAVLEFDSGQILGFASLSFLIMLAIEAVFVRLLMRRKRNTEDAGDIVLMKGQATKELDVAPVRTLPEPLASVTEHTTRAFEPILSKRK